MKKIKMILEKTNTGFSAYAEDYQIKFSANQIENILSTVKNHIFDWAVCCSG